MPQKFAIHRIVFSSLLNEEETKMIYFFLKPACFKRKHIRLFYMHGRSHESCDVTDFFPIHTLYISAFQSESIFHPINNRFCYFCWLRAWKVCILLNFSGRYFCKITNPNTLDINALIHILDFSFSIRKKNAPCQVFFSRTTSF